LQKSSGIINDGTGKSQTRIQLSNNISRLEREGQLPKISITVQPGKA